MLVTVLYRLGYIEAKNESYVRARVGENCISFAFTHSDDWVYAMHIFGQLSRAPRIQNAQITYPTLIECFGNRPVLLSCKAMKVIRQLSAVHVVS